MHNITKEQQDKSFHSQCPVCYSKNLQHKFDVNKFTIVECKLCELIFVKEKLTQEVLDHYYSEIEGHVYGDQENLENLNYYFCNLKSRILKKVVSGAILDVGCDMGGFLDVMDGFDRYGVERSNVSGSIAKKKYGDNIFIGTFEDYQAPNILFDCITLQDLFDHVVDPLEVLNKCYRLLKPNGLLVIKVHDISCLYAKITGKNFYAFIPPIHLFYYNKKSLTQALEKSSFKVADSEHMGHMLSISTVFYRLSKGNPSSPFFRMYKFLNRTWLGKKKIYKNFHDIITVFAIKK